jgi:hypothetical protein
MHSNKHKQSKPERVSERFTPSPTKQVVFLTEEGLTKVVSMNRAERRKLIKKEVRRKPN